MVFLFSSLFYSCAQGENRTLMMLPSIDFESIASTNSATWASRQTGFASAQMNITSILQKNQFVIYLQEKNFYVKMVACPPFIQTQFSGLTQIKLNRIRTSRGEISTKPVYWIYLNLSNN